MSQLPNGMIVFLRDQLLPGPKLLDIEITNTFPLIAITQKTYLVRPTQDIEILRGYDHIAIPPDFRLHVSSLNDHIFFDATPVWNMVKTSRAKPLHYFTIVGLPSARALPLVSSGQTRKWYQAMIISPFKDKKFNSATRLFVDFFLHHLPVNSEAIYKAPFAMQGMRLAADQHGSILGPYSFASLQRKKKLASDIAFSMRFGFANIEENEANYIYTPLNIFQKRLRL